MSGHRRGLALLTFAGAAISACTLFTDLGDLSGGGGSEDGGAEGLFDSRSDDAPDAPAGSVDPIGLGTGRDGDLVVDDSRIVNLYLPLTAIARPGDLRLSLDGAGLGPGDVIMIWQTGGAGEPPVSGNQADIGLEAPYGGYELRRIAGADASSVTLVEPIAGSYDAHGSQVVRLPQYDTLTIRAGASIRAKPWDGRAGGVVAMLVRGALHSEGAVVADASGFRGGRSYRMAVPACAGELDGTPDQTYFAKGEGLYLPGYTGPSDPIAAGVGGRGNLLNGAGGSSCANNGGGGGGNGTAGGPGGDSAGFGKGGLGGARVTGSLLRRLTMGAGGGAGGVDSLSTTLDGGAGGGAVFLRAGSITGNGTLSADGERAVDVVGEGGAGGGAGGSLVVRVANGAACVAHARGANGAKAESAKGNVLGPGGGGGGGRALLQAQAVSCPVDVSSGVAGAFAWDGGAVATHAGPTAPEPGFVEPVDGGYVP